MTVLVSFVKLVTSFRFCIALHVFAHCKKYCLFFIILTSWVLQLRLKWCLHCFYTLLSQLTAKVVPRSHTYCAFLVKRSGRAPTYTCLLSTYEYTLLPSPTSTHLRNC
jgi:hypothetical protein